MHKKTSLALAALGLAFAFTGLGFGGSPIPSTNAQTVTPYPTPTSIPAPTVTPLTPTPVPTLTPTPVPTATPFTATPSATAPSPAVTPASTSIPGTSVGIGTSVPSGGYIQFNDLAVTSVSGATAPAVVLATPSSGTCTAFANVNDTIGTPVICPLPPAGATSTYTVNVTGATQLMLSDRTAAVLGNFTPGDVINVYGYYNGDGSIQAQVVRDLSKPAAPGLAPSTALATSTPTAVTAPATPAGLTTPVVAPNPTAGQLLQILQTLMIQVQGVLTQLIQMSGTNAVSSTPTSTP